MSTIDIRNLNLPQVGVQTDDTTVATSTPSTVVGTPQPTIQNPFAVGYVAQSTSVDLPNGTSLNLPNLTQEDLQQVSTLFGGMSPTQLDNVNQASQRLGQGIVCRRRRQFGRQHPLQHRVRQRRQWRQCCCHGRYRHHQPNQLAIGRAGRIATGG